MAISEYDAFGPWIYEIDEEHPLPRLFAPHLQECARPLMLFKIPRDIERRAATPDMDLYDYVAGAYEDHIRILKRTGQSVKTFSVPYRDIEGVHLFRHLLRGILTLYLREGETEIPFNTVSMDIMTRFLDLIRARYKAGAVPEAAAQPRRPEPAGLDILFVNLLKDLRQEGTDIRLCFYQPMTPLEPRDDTFLKGLAHRLRPRKLPAALHLLTPEELIVIQQGPPAKKSQDKKYSYDFTYLPLGNVRQASLTESASYKSVTDCTIQLPHHSVPVFIDGENRDTLNFYQKFAASVH